jgi:hypothetical protein
MGLHALIFVAPNFLDLLYHASPAEVVVFSCLSLTFQHSQTLSSSKKRVNAYVDSWLYTKTSTKLTRNGDFAGDISVRTQIPHHGHYFAYSALLHTRSLIIGKMLLSKRKWGIRSNQRYKFSRWLAGPTGIEPAAYGLRVRRSSLTELRAHGNFSRKRTSIKRYRAYGYAPRFYADFTVQSPLLCISEITGLASRKVWQSAPLSC